MAGLDLPVEEIAAGYRAGATTTELAARWGCSPGTIRARLVEAGITLRPVGRTPLPVPAEVVVRLREEQHLTWAGIAARVGVSESTARSVYRAAGGRTYGRPGLRPSRDEHSADVQADDLVDGQADDFADDLADGLAGGLVVDPLWSVGERQQELESWRPGQDLAALGPAWCTQDEAAAILAVSRGQVYRLVYELGVLQPWYVAGGRWLLRRADVQTAARLVDPERRPGRWDAARAAVGSSRLPARPRVRAGRVQPEPPQARRVNRLPWEQIVADYQAGTSTRELADRHRITVATVRKRLKAHGVGLPAHPPAVELSLSDSELARRHAAGTSVTDLAATCGVSTVTIYRHLRRTGEGTGSNPE